MKVKIVLAMDSIYESVPKCDPQPTMVACPVKEYHELSFTSIGICFTQSFYLFMSFHPSAGRSENSHTYKY